MIGVAAGAAGIAAILPPHALARQGMLGAMRGDDRPVGFPLTRRDALALLGAGGLAALAAAEVRMRPAGAAGSGPCVARPALTEGPFFVDDRLERSDQLTDGEGLARFMTIYPGWYPGRAVHIHFKIRSAAGGGRAHEFTSQLFFDDALTDQVHARPPYAGRGLRRVRNPSDGIYRDAGAQLTLAATPAGAGYAASFDLALETG
jgi:hypothetical protein